MNFRVTGVLLVVLAVLGSYLYFTFIFGKEEKEEALLPKDVRPWFYFCEDQQIRGLDVAYFGRTLSFVRDDSRVWHFDGPDGPLVDTYSGNEEQGIKGSSFSGVPFLAGGARSKRVFEEVQQTESLEFYGLKDPKVSFTMKLYPQEQYKDSPCTEAQYTVRLGTTTPDGVQTYAQMEGYPQIFLVDHTWGETVARVVTEPPYPPATPRPTPGGLSPAL
ncbi:MAG: DUF4340 domain-containing protein [Chloroflexi bacterium]|nr:DUF4340 domain-containing protein [Chloroflexota bacterium]